MKKTIIRITLITMLAITLSVQSVFAAEGNVQEIDSNTENPIEFTYSRISDRTVEITGFTGDAEGDLIIPQTIDGYEVSGIGENAFYSCDGFTGDLIVPDSVESIGNNAFYDCGFEGRLNLSEKLKSIGDAAFYGCNFTGNLVLPESLEEVGTKAFYGCRFTGNLNIPESLTSIGDNGFSDAFNNDFYVLKNHLNIDKISSGFSSTAFFDSVFIVSKGSLRVGEKHQNLVCTSGELLLPSSMVTKWSSDDPNVATVDSNGIVTAIAVGKTRINVETYNGITKSIVIAVKESAEKINRGEITWHIPERIKLGYEFRDPDDDSNRDISEGVSIATVKGLSEYIDGKHYCLTEIDEGRKFFNYLILGALGREGLIMMDEAHPTFDGFYAVSPGTMKFRLVVFDMSTGEEVSIGEPYEVTIEEPVISTNEPAEVYVGDTVTLKSELQNTVLQNEEIGSYKDQLEAEKDQSYHFISDHIVYEPQFIIESGEELVDCSEGDFSHMLTASEKLTFKKAGTIKIRVRYQHLKLNTEMWDFYSPEKTITIQVRDKNTSVISLRLNRTTVRLTKGQTTNLSATVLPSDALNKAVQWISSNPKVATINNGKVTARKLGKASVTVRAADGSGKTAKCKVIVGYPVKYKLNGGKNNSANPGAYYKENISLKKPTRKGYIFKGWYTDKKYKKKISKITTKDAKKLTLYAKWEKISVGKSKIASLKNNANGKAVLKFKGISRAKGYEVIYGTDKKLKKGTKAVTTKRKSVTLKGLQKKKTYYVKVRAYCVDSTGKKVYGEYSSVKQVKIRNFL